MATVPLVNLLDALLQKAYHDLNVLQELLRNKSDGDRKVEIVKYAQHTRALLIRLLALVKWAGNSSSVQKCSEMSVMLSQQSGLYVDTADQLVQLVRSTLVSACAPNFSLAPAVDVLTTGCYPRLPTCIKDRILPLPSLKEEEEEQAFSLINCAIRRRLLREKIPERMSVTFIGDGVIRFKVPYEFELTLSVLSEDFSIPWRLISIKVIVGEALANRPVLLHKHQKLYLHQLVQSRLYSEDTPLQDCYQCLHSFCLSLQLDSLHSQATQLGSEVYGGYIKVEEYYHAHHLKIMYWRPGSSQFMSAFLLDQARTLPSPRVLISIDSSRASQPFSTHHSPPLPPGAPEIGVSASSLSLETLLKGCVRVRSHSLLKGIKLALKGTTWDEDAQLQEIPLSLKIKVPLKYSTRFVVLGVDPRVGNIVAIMEPRLSVGKVQQCLEELEKAVTSSWSNLPAQLEKLQCHLFVAEISEQAKELDLPVHWSLPLVHPLPVYSVAVLYLELHPLTYLVVSVVEGFLDHYHLLSVSPTSLLTPAVTPSSGGTPSPKLFFATSSLVELNLEELSLQHLRTVKVDVSGPLLKRKLLETNLSMPSLKRVCRREPPDFSPLPGLIKSRMVLLAMRMSLHAIGISYDIACPEFGSPSANIYSFPPPYNGKSVAMHELLTNSLKSCQITHSSSNYTCTFVFTPLTLGGQSSCDQGAVVLTQSVPIAEPGGARVDLGQTLLGQWQARATLLGLTLELQQYLDDVHWPLHTSCAISEFTYDQLSFSFGRHQLYVKATPTGLSLSFSPDCPHSLVKESLESFLTDTHSLPLLLQGLCITEETMNTLGDFVKRVPTLTISATTPSQIQLTYDHCFCLGLNMQAQSTIAFTDIKYIKATFPSLHLNPPSYLQAFLHSVFSDSNVDSEDSGGEKTSTATTTAPPTSSAQKPSLYPIPSPISFPRRSSYPDSVPSLHGFSIPSIPPFPSPAIGSGMGHGALWNCQLTLEQFNQLLSATPSHPIKPDSCVVGCSLLQSFLGSISMLFQALLLANKHQMAFVQCDRGIYTYRNDNNHIIAVMAIEGAMMRMTVKAARENVWANSELNTLMELFKRDVMCAPFSLHGVISYLTLLNLPLLVLKNCVQLILYQLTPPSGLVWHYNLCITIPPGADLTGTPFFKGGPAIIYGRNKLLLFLRFERVQDQKSFILPLMYDPKTNLTYVARFQNQYRNNLQPYIDSILKRASSEIAAAAGQIPSHLPPYSLYPAVRSLAQTPLNF